LEAALSTNPDRKDDPLYTHGKVSPKKKKPTVPRKAYAVRLSHDEHVKLKERAKAAGCATVSEYIRSHHADAPPKPVQRHAPEVAHLIAEVRAVGVNANQISRHLNEQALLGLISDEQIERAVVARQWIAAAMAQIMAKLGAL
jgi:hypothetical protein